jgi:hypothetical protein
MVSSLTAIALGNGMKLRWGQKQRNLFAFPILVTSQRNIQEEYEAKE